MRAKLIKAAMMVVSDNCKGSSAVIEDVIKQAKVSRGTFYNYFQSMDELRSGIGEALNEQMVEELLPIYDPIKRPEYRFCVGSRVFLMRALYDPDWASFVKISEVWSQEVLVANIMSRDLEAGKNAKVFYFENLEVTSDFILGGVASGIQALLKGVKEPYAYIEQNIRLALTSIKCDEDLIDESLEFSRAHIRSWISGKLIIENPPWLKLESMDALTTPK
tara:strand:- start:8884 stop:9543 length:660 start_codon:yes stop_codon:yes gene_type:complete